MKSDGAFTDDVRTRSGKKGAKRAKMVGLVPFVVHVCSIKVKMQLFPDKSGRGGG